jgi:hypothetical protein
MHGGQATVLLEGRPVDAWSTHPHGSSRNSGSAQQGVELGWGAGWTRFGLAAHIPTRTMYAEREQYQAGQREARQSKIG